MVSLTGGTTKTQPQPKSVAAVVSRSDVVFLQKLTPACDLVAPRTQQLNLIHLGRCWLSSLPALRGKVALLQPLKLKFEELLLLLGIGLPQPLNLLLLLCAGLPQPLDLLLLPCVSLPQQLHLMLLLCADLLQPLDFLLPL